MHTKQHLYLVLELGPRDLFQFFDEQPNGVEESTAKIVMFNLLSVVDQCHSTKIYHRDLKPEVIFSSNLLHASYCLNL